MGLEGFLSVGRMRAGAERGLGGGRCGQGRWGPWGGTTRGRPEGLEKATGRQGGPTSGGWTGKEVLAEGPVISVQTGGPHWPFQGLQGHG